MHISVALCTHNGARWLGAQLDSIAAQALPPHELVISDDASSDDTLAVARAFASRAPFPVRVEANARALGVGANFGAAMARCTGDWIAFADQDDVWHPEKLASLARAAAAHPGADLLFSDARCVDASLAPLGYSLWDAVGFDARRQARWARGGAVEVLLWRNVVTGAAAMLRADRRALVLPIGEGWIHDGWTALLLALVGSVVPVPEPLVDYRQHERNQVGARPLSVSERAERARAMPREEYARQHAMLHRVRERALASLDSLSPDERSRLASQLPRLDEKLAHLARRAALPAARWRRAAGVGAELARGRYHRFSSGWWSAGRDLFIR